MSRISQALELDPPEPVNPLVAMLPEGVDPDMDAWNQWFQDVSADLGPLTLAGAVPLLGEQEPNNAIAQATPLAGVGTGPNDVAHVVATGSIRAGIGVDPGLDPDFFSVELEVGDVLGVNVVGATGVIEARLFGPEQFQRLRTTGDVLAVILPDSSPLPRGGAGQAFAYTAERAGSYAIELRSFASSLNQTPAVRNYQLEVGVFRPNLESAAPGERQILFIDFDGAVVTAEQLPTVGAVPGSSFTLRPLADFLDAAGLSGQLDAVIDGVLARIRENLREDLRASGINPMTSIDIRNSRDDADPGNAANVSRVVVGGSAAETGIVTIGIASTIDPGNFHSEDVALVLLDVITADGILGTTLRNVPLAAGASYLDLVAAFLGNAASHEAGHFLGNFHTTNQRGIDEGPLVLVPENIMDEGGGLSVIASFAGAGDDGIFGSADDVDVDFGPGSFSVNEGFGTTLARGFQDTLANTAFGLSSTCTFANVVEHTQAGRASFQIIPLFGVELAIASVVGSNELIAATVIPAGTTGFDRLLRVVPVLVTGASITQTAPGSFALCETDGLPAIFP